jgi:hypothetical protein
VHGLGLSLLCEVFQRISDARTHFRFIQLKLLQSPFQEEFNRAPDVPWPTVEDATVRVVGEGAGNMTYILVAQAGHFVRHFSIHTACVLTCSRLLETNRRSSSQSLTIGFQTIRSF